MPEPLEPIEKGKDATEPTGAEREERPRQRRRDAARFGDEQPSGTFRIPRV